MRFVLMLLMVFAVPVPVDGADCLKRLILRRLARQIDRDSRRLSRHEGLANSFGALGRGGGSHMSMDAGGGHMEMDGGDYGGGSMQQSYGGPQQMSQSYGSVGSSMQQTYTPQMQQTYSMPVQTYQMVPMQQTYSTPVPCCEPAPVQAAPSYGSNGSAIQTYNVPMQSSIKSYGSGNTTRTVVETREPTVTIETHTPSVLTEYIEAPSGL